MGKYKKDGKELPRCTDIISDCTDKSGPLTQWAANMVCEWIRKNGNYVPLEHPFFKNGYWCLDESNLEQARIHFKEISQTALDVGSMVHKAVEDYLKGKPVVFTAETPDQVQEAFAAFRKWENDHNLKPISLEQTVYGDCWAGTLDFLGYFDDKLYVIDWKSSKAHYKEMDYQVAAYRSVSDGIDKPFSDIAQGCGVLRLDKETGLPEWKDTSKTYEKDLAVFNAMKRLYFLRHPKVAKNAGWNTPF